MTSVLTKAFFFYIQLQVLNKVIHKMFINAQNIV